MQKRIINHHAQKSSPVDEGWFDLEKLAQVEVSSEQAQHPIEAAPNSLRYLSPYARLRVRRAECVLPERTGTQSVSTSRPAA